MTAGGRVATPLDCFGAPPLAMTTCHPAVLPAFPPSFRLQCGAIAALSQQTLGKVQALVKLCQLG